MCTIMKQAIYYFNILLALLFTCNCVAQNVEETLSSEKHYAQEPSLVIGSSLSYIWDTELVNGRNFTYWNEYTWRLNAAISIRNKWKFGVNSNYIFTKGFLRGRNNYNMLGLFAQYNLVPDTLKGGGLFLELNLNRGDFCTCQNTSNAEPFRYEGLTYVGFGAGYEFKLWHNWYGEASFLNHIITNPIEGKYNYTLYVVAIKYRLPLKGYTREKD